MQGMDTDDPIYTHPEYSRAYYHYIQHGSIHEDASRLAREHTEKYVADNPPPRPSFSRRRPFLTAVLVVGGIVAVATALWFAPSSGGGGTVPGSDDRSGSARLACQDFVRDRLKAPSTAEFSGLFSTDIQRNRDRYVVRGTVDAENSFGAKLHHDYHCTVTLEGKQWRLDSLTISE